MVRLLEREKIIGVAEKEKQKPVKIAKAVHDVVRVHGGQFSVADVCAVLKEKGFQVGTANKKLVVMAVITRLIKAGYAEKTFTGSGPVPNRYALVKPLPD